MTKFSSCVSNWCIYFIILVIILVIIWCVYKYIKNSHNQLLPDDDSFYFLTVDDLGNESLIHDSGIRPSKIPPGDITNVQILKKDYKDGNPIHVSTPVYLKMGLNPNNLKWNIYPEDILDENTHYTVKIKIPENAVYGTNVKTFIDERIECEEFTSTNNL